MAKRASSADIAPEQSASLAALLGMPIMAASILRGREDMRKLQVGKKRAIRLVRILDDAVATCLTREREMGVFLSRSAPAQLYELESHWQSQSGSSWDVV